MGRKQQPKPEDVGLLVSKLAEATRLGLQQETEIKDLRRQLEEERRHPYRLLERAELAEAALAALRQREKALAEALIRKHDGPRGPWCECLICKRRWMKQGIPHHEPACPVAAAVQGEENHAREGTSISAQQA